MLCADLRPEMSEFKMLRSRVIVDGEPGMEYREKTAECKTAKPRLTGRDVLYTGDADS